MKKSNKYLFLLTVLLLGINSIAQESDPEPSLEEAIESQRPTPRVAPPTKLTEQDWEEAKKGLDYGSRKPQEAEEEDPEDDATDEADEEDGPSWFEKMLNDLQNISINQKFLSAFLIGMVILILVWLIVRLIGNQQKNANTRLSPSELEFALTEAEENLEESDLERLLRISIEQSDYKTAIRVYYLSVLKSLSLSGLIKWKKDKTNADYLKEMMSDTQFEDFRMATYTYEKVWYGDTEVTARDHEQLAPLFKRFLELENNG